MGGESVTTLPPWPQGSTRVCPMERGKIPFLPLLAAILDFCGVNISKTVRDGTISSEFLIYRVVQDYPMQRGTISIFATFGGHLGILRKMKKCEYLENCTR